MNGSTHKDNGGPWKQYHDKIDDTFAKTGKRNEIIERTRQQLYQSKWSEDIQERFSKHVKSKVRIVLLICL
jgi:hypothetical protein